MQKHCLGRLDRPERDLRRSAESVEISFENSFDGKKSRLYSRLADCGQRVGSITERGQMRMLGCEITIHAEGLTNFESVKTARLAIQIEAQRGHQSREKARAQLTEFGRERVGHFNRARIAMDSGKACVIGGC